MVKKVIKVVKKVLVKKRKAPPSETDAAPPAKKTRAPVQIQERAGIEIGAKNIDSNAPAEEMNSAQALASSSSSTTNDRSVERRKAATKSATPPAACHLLGKVDAEKLFHKLLEADIPGIRRVSVRKNHKGVILRFTTPNAALSAILKKEMEIAGVPFVFRPRRTSKQLYMNGDFFAALHAVLSQALGELTCVEWAVGLKAATLSFANKAEADHAAANVYVQLAPDVYVEVRPTKFQARLFMDLPKLLHAGATEALPGLVKLTCSSSMKSAIAIFWGSSNAKHALEAGQVDILGREVIVGTRKSRVVNLEGEYECQPFTGAVGITPLLSQPPESTEH